ncbi:MAG: isoaspartyl peptidase/L-asparaginase [Bacteroidetes bacterium]|nr:isoaspartyl peptidase/L-asparaginase [Bacteroidota bacterium]
MHQQYPVSRFLLLSIVLIFSCQAPPPIETSKNNKQPWAIALHGGAGTLSRTLMTPEREAAYRAALDTALMIGETVLKNGGSSLDAVSQTIIYLEDCPLFNAGRGAVFNHEGKNELDASIMDGSTQKAGAVGSVSVVKNPILLARAVMEHSPHVLLTGRGAEQFAREQGIQTIEPSWFFTQERWNTLQDALKEEARENGKHGGIFKNSDFKFGTVGCVALDQHGHLAAGTSTGGMTNKRWNRLGDTPLVGAGTYADDDVVAVSCTGHGEYFIRYAVAHDVWARMAYQNLSVQEAGNRVIMQKLKEKGGEGGLIAVDKNGNVTMPFNSEGMYRAYANPDTRKIAIYQE